MTSLPVPVSDEDIAEMFQFADKDDDGKLSYAEFLVKTFRILDKIQKTLQKLNPLKTNCLWAQK